MKLILEINDFIIFGGNVFAIFIEICEFCKLQEMSLLVGFQSPCTPEEHCLL